MRNKPAPHPWAPAVAEENPCDADCPRRSATCHASCPDYARYSAKMAARRAKRLEDARGRYVSYGALRAERANLRQSKRKR